MFLPRVLLYPWMAPPRTLLRFRGELVHSGAGLSSSRVRMSAAVFSRPRHPAGVCASICRQQTTCHDNGFPVRFSEKSHAWIFSFSSCILTQIIKYISKHISRGLKCAVVHLNVFYNSHQDVFFCPLNDFHESNEWIFFNFELVF